MNLKSRIKRIEKASQTKTGIDCECFVKQNLALLNQAYGEEFNPLDILPDGTPIEGVCIRCGKQISPQVKVQYQMLELCYGDKNEHQTQA